MALVSTVPFRNRAVAVAWNFLRDGTMVPLIIEASEVKGLKLQAPQKGDSLLV